MPTTEGQVINAATTYERPQIRDFGTLFDLTAMMNVGGPEDALQKGVAHDAPPGHTCPIGPPPGNTHSGSQGNSTADPPCVGNGGGVGGGNNFGQSPGNPANPGRGNK
jgi:hypothetical protein